MKLLCCFVFCLVTILGGCSDPRDEKKAARRPPEGAAPAIDWTIPANPTTLPTNRDPTAAEIAIGYTSLSLMTPEPVWVGAALTVACIGPTPQQEELSRKTYGVHDNNRINVFMNDRAAKIFQSSKHSYPVGSIIVKQKQFRGVGGMIKRSPGFDPEHGDWEYFYFEDSQKIQSGKIASCVNCHAGAGETDHVFGGWASKDGH